MLEFVQRRPPRAEAKRRASRRHFDRWARHYERDRVSRRLAGLAQTALDALALGPDDRFADVGCGTGAAVRSAAATAARAVGVDLSRAMVERGRELAAGLANVELLEADAEALPFAGGSFTALLCTTSLHHYPHPRRAIAEMARVLAPGGRLAIADATTDLPLMVVADRLLRLFQRSHAGMLRAIEIEQLIAAAGLAKTDSRPLLGRVYVLVLARRPL